MHDQNVNYSVELGLVNHAANPGMMLVIHHPDKPAEIMQNSSPSTMSTKTLHLAKNMTSTGATMAPLAVAKSIDLYPGQFFLIESHPTISATKKSQLVLRHVRHVTFLQINWAKANESLASAKYCGKHNIKAIECPIPTTIWSNF